MYVLVCPYWSFSLFIARFWRLLAPYCTVHAVVRETPFVTSFGRGCGKTASIDGKVITTIIALLHLYVQSYDLYGHMTIPLCQSRKYMYPTPHGSWLEIPSGRGSQNPKLK